MSIVLFIRVRLGYISISHFPFAHPIRIDTWIRTPNTESIVTIYNVCNNLSKLMTVVRSSCVFLSNLLSILLVACSFIWHRPDLQVSKLWIIVIFSLKFILSNVKKLRMKKVSFFLKKKRERNRWIRSKLSLIF